LKAIELKEQVIITPYVKKGITKMKAKENVHDFIEKEIPKSSHQKRSPRVDS